MKETCSGAYEDKALKTVKKPLNCQVAADLSKSWLDLQAVVPG